MPKIGRIAAAVLCGLLLSLGRSDGRLAAESPPFDYIVVGAGAAGSVIANRLTENPDIRVLALEAGGPDTDERIYRPSAFRELPKSEFDWDFSTEEEAGLEGRRVSWPRGKVWGGSGSISAMVYARGRPSDFDHWEAMGNPGWGFDDVLPYFKKAENQERGPSRWHHVGGPQNVADSRWAPPISTAFLQAALEIGIPRNDDFNGDRQEGVGFYQLNQKNGERHSAAAAYLRPALHRHNLTVTSHALVTKILMDGTRATGVAYLREGKAYEAKATRGVILSAGAVGSPQLLMLSGIGPADHLASLGIPVVRDLPGVGRNLQDHVRVAVTFASVADLGPSEEERERAVAAYRKDRTGPLAGNGVGSGVFLQRSDEDPFSSFQIFLTANPPARTFSVHAALMHPRSRGRITLRSADPTAAPVIEANYLQDPADLDALAWGLETARRIANANALDGYRGDELAPGADAWGHRDLLEAFVRQNATTFYHPVGTCKMGSDAQSVVDPQLRVRGVEGLRVIDSSVMPALISGATHAATVMIAEKGADLIKREW